ncbi:DNA-directed RNA polymerase subunit alpha C-terminal domain-containing protein [Variovorax sp. HW608]|jgi:DNA-directed RNA polymerase alpha subunit|uniref:DNA-directed RNA polymerase subunit alpha C-terminal domain-containing protein n=1 Tax=Variovorax sp. HW608 TaxID=1034889 RepID=UPI000B5B0628|nr:DNA-directed RNA polymerase subunit alpha C-terminal domain-containing protein [Variovorax sp. HW608]
MDHRQDPVTAAAAAHPVLDADIAILDLSLRTTNVLRLNELHTVRDLTRLPARKLFVLSRLGRNSLREIVESVNRKGLRLAD